MDLSYLLHQFFTSGGSGSMPIYEYRCKKCGDFELSQRITDSPLERCPTCKGKVSKLISNTSFQLKGNGWYATDYARKGTSGTETPKPEGKEADSTQKPATETSSAKDSSTKESPTIRKESSSTASAS
jgi:putative FmdB family regulatory protein